MTEPIIWFCGDTHGSLEHIERAYQSEGPCDVIVHLGDFDLQVPLSLHLSPAVRERFWWIPGNHDFDDEVARRCLFDDPLVTQCLHSRQMTVSGVRLAGLGGTFKGRIWRPPEPASYANPSAYLQRTMKSGRGSSLLQSGCIWPDQIKFLSGRRAEILVTHEAPSCHRHGFAVLDDLAHAMGAALVVHGHHHEDYDATINGGRTRVIGVGFRGITDQHGRRIVPGSRGNRSAPVLHRTIPSPSPAPTGESP